VKDDWRRDGWLNSEFAAVNDAGFDRLEEEELLREISARQYVGASHSQTWLMPVCAHPPRCVLKSEQDGWEVWAGRRGDCLDEAAKFDVLLNLSGSPILARHHIPLAGFERWEQQFTTKEVLLDWPDMGVVALPAEFWRELIGFLGQTKAKTLVFCVGGHGRTGTALACLMVACGWTSADAVAWIRKNYCDAAIETRAQETYINSVERGRLKASTVKRSSSRMRREIKS
jgi:hypothetical protein